VTGKAARSKRTAATKQPTTKATVRRGQRPGRRRPSQRASELAEILPPEAAASDGSACAAWRAGGLSVTGRPLAASVTRRGAAGGQPQALSCAARFRPSTGLETEAYRRHLSPKPPGPS